MTSTRNLGRNLILVVVCCISLSGCKEVLFSGLHETEANEMVAVLAAAGVKSSRERDKDNIYSLLVSQDDIATATTLLRAQGYPQPKFESLGDVFSAEGIVGTPFEQHVRYVHAMNEELSHTITLISGVKSARVFITAPTKDRYENQAPPASASVAITYGSDFDEQSDVSKIKTIIAHSVPNLDYDDVAVALFEASGPAVRANIPATADLKFYEAGLLPDVGGSIVNSEWVLPVIGVFSLLVAALLYLMRTGSGLARGQISRRTGDHPGAD